MSPAILVKRVVAIVVVAAIGLVVLSFVVGWSLARPVERSVGAPPPDLLAEDVQFSSDSGTIVHGWWCAQPSSSAAILLLPGVRANRLDMVSRARFLRRAGYSVLLIDLQATGETPGREITFGWLERKDVLGAVNFIRQKQPGIRIGIVGSSLGGAATLLASPPLNVDGIVLEAVYPTIDRATSNRLRNYLGPLGPLGAPLLLSQLRFRLGVSADQLRPVDHIASVHCPVLVINGLNDRRTTPEDARMLYASARSPKELWLVPKVGHVDLHRAMPREYEVRVLSFFAAIGLNHA
jgi:uncharacterized protein